MKFWHVLTLTFSGLALHACEQHTVNDDLTVYETSDNYSAIYVLDNRFVIGRAMVDNQELYDYINDVAQPIEADSRDCTKLGDLVLPKNLRSLKCEEQYFQLTPAEGGWVLSSDCAENCSIELQLTSNDGSAIDVIQFWPTVEGSKPYRLVRGEPLKIPRGT